jgi:hypothetical protein
VEKEVGWFHRYTVVETPGGGHSGRNETFLCIFEKNIFLDILDDSKNILENWFFDQTSS